MLRSRWGLSACGKYMTHRVWLWIRIWTSDTIYNINLYLFSAWCLQLHCAALSSHRKGTSIHITQVILGHLTCSSNFKILFNCLFVALWVWAGWKQICRRGYDRPVQTSPPSTSTRACRTSQHISMHTHKTHRHSHILRTHDCCPVGTSGRAKTKLIYVIFCCYVYCCNSFYFTAWSCSKCKSRRFTEGKTKDFEKDDHWQFFVCIDAILRKEKWLLGYIYIFFIIIVLWCVFCLPPVKTASTGWQWRSYWFVFQSPIFQDEGLCL